MRWLSTLAHAQPVAHALLAIAVVVATGLGLGSLRVRGLSLGVAGVLFAGLLLGHLGVALEPGVLSFARELGLLLFVFAIGMQIGPGFLASLRARGLVLNALAAGVVALGAAVALGVGALFELPPATVAGLFAGATTNTPALAAAEEALLGMPSAARGSVASPAVAYAAAYPLGIVGILSSMVLLRAALRISPPAEAEALARRQAAAVEPVQRLNLVVDNPELEGVRVSHIPDAQELGVVITRLKSGAGEVRPASPGSIVRRGDTLLAVGPASGLERLRALVGRVADQDLSSAQGPVRSERAVVTHAALVGRTLSDVDLRGRFGVTVSRVHRAGVDLSAVPDVRLCFGDVLQIVGDADAVAQARAAIGDSVKDMQHTNFLPIFAGMAAGVALGALAWPLPGIPSPLKLGLAGGPLVTAIALSRIGRLGPLVWYVPANANAALRDLGIVLFLACVGLKAGPQFVATASTAHGAQLVALGAAVTILPLLAVGLLAGLVLRTNFVELLGVMAGSMTDPPALAFANGMSRSDAPAIAYAAVYPLTMLLRIVCAQLMVLLLAS